MREKEACEIERMAHPRLGLVDEDPSLWMKKIDIRLHAWQLNYWLHAGVRNCQLLGRHADGTAGPQINANVHRALVFW